MPHSPGECRTIQKKGRVHVLRREWSGLGTGDGERGEGLDPIVTLFCFSGLPKADPGHWWANFFFGKSSLPFMATVLESPEQ